MTKSCGTCRYFKPREDYPSEMAECVRFPPTLVAEVSGAVGTGNDMAVRGSTSTTVYSFFPDVRADGWCGEWTMKGEAS